MTTRAPTEISEYHAHIYYDAASKPVAAGLRQAVEKRLRVRMGSWHDRPVGPHPAWSYRIAFAPEHFGELVPWLTLNRAGLTVFVHPVTGDDLADHSDHVIWLGQSAELDLDGL